ncbi:hypothetical protein GCK72_016817 [Caenorhabditis remanei]|uniref:Sdz-33 F-box domain-containing protein n=1 Tax=Caenorhabditis remanei TaxID=31234 RepID=A0A6A5G5M8_CAERE|nr:hypothetical protein GCK72_016817 [Caenorhabditis remanei]KAF1750270.1 hypothetical protein GCK72_016817 [Caenorhabditis remanei]
MKLLRIIKEVFLFCRHSIIFHLDSYPLQNKAIIDFIKSRTPSIDGCDIYGKTETDEDVEYFLNNLNVTEYVRIDVKLSDSFRFPQDNYLEYFVVYSASWVTFDQLLHLNASRLYIHGSILTNQELNSYLLLWMTSQCHQNLKFLLIDITEPQSLDTILNLPHERINPDVERIVRLPNNDTILLKEGIDIKRNDGMTGTIHFDWRLDKMRLMIFLYKWATNNECQKRVLIAMNRYWNKDIK